MPISKGENRDKKARHPADKSDYALIAMIFGEEASGGRSRKKVIHRDTF